jgi:hypothetical protein
MEGSDNREGCMGLWERLHKDEVAASGPSVLEAMARAEERREVWGRPSRCPRCNGVGYLDRVDLVDRVQYEHCTECFHKWQVTEADTVKTSV